MGRFTEPLQWIRSQAGRLGELVTDWARINSGSYHTDGLARCADAIVDEARDLGGDIRFEALPPQEQIDAAGNIVRRPLGKAIRIVRRPDAPLRVLLCIHYDTVYGSEHPFQTVQVVGPNRLCGPGVTDAKGGLVVMLTALRALERSPFAAGVGWEMFINPDEEIGSPGSAALLAEAAGRHDLGLLFEPALESGMLVGARKGSGNFTAVVRGRSAHAGRDPEAGRNAIHALADLIAAVAAINGIRPGITTNVGQIEGGGAVNVVPDLAIARFNVRAATAAEQRQVEETLQQTVTRIAGRDGLRVELHGGFHARPKELDAPALRLLAHVADCGRELGLALDWRPSGGACDGNNLAAAGLPNVDSLGVRGGAIHSAQEYLLLDSLVERASLSALLLMKLSAGDIAWVRRAGVAPTATEGRPCS